MRAVLLYLTVFAHSGFSPLPLIDIDPPGLGGGHLFPQCRAGGYAV